MKHAYLITAHKETRVLQTLLMLIDAPCNDIYIHIDAKTKNFDFNKVKTFVQKSKLIFTDRVKDYWGDYSQIKSELVLLKAAIGGGYDYYHLISGQDLPIKSISEINKFFENNSGKEFISLGNAANPIKPTDKGGVFSLYSRLSLYHFGIKGWRKNKLLKGLEYISILTQRKLKVNRIAKLNVPVYYGSNWFSITHDCAKYVIEQEDYIEELFGKHTRCADELFLQTVVMNSNLKSRVTGYNLRHIDFNRGRPYTWHEEDLSELLNSKDLFARKFNEDVDGIIIEKLYQTLKNS